MKPIGFPKPVKLTEKQKLAEKLAKMKARQQKQIEKMRTKTKAKSQKARQMPLSQLKKKTQKIVNAYVLQRDKDKGCISCGRKDGQFHAGHYINQGSCSFLRYDTTNIWKQCVGCNLFKHGNLIEYRASLVKLIGPGRVGELESFRHETYKYTRKELENIIEKTKQLTKENI